MESDDEVLLGGDGLRFEWTQLQSSFEGEARHFYASARAIGQAKRLHFGDHCTTSAGAWLTAEYSPQNLCGDKEASSSSHKWWKSWLGRYGLAVVLVLYIIVDRAVEVGLLRSSASTDACDGCTLTSRMQSDFDSVPSSHIAQFQHTIEAVDWQERDPDCLRERLRRFFGWQWEGPVRKVHVLKTEFPRRMASSSSGSSSSSSSSSSSAGGHASHPHEAMFFLILALVAGVGVTQVLSLPLFHGMQQSVVLFVVGVVMALCVEGANLSETTGAFGRSFDMWMSIDPHLLLFTLLPPLVTGDAMAIDTTIAKRVALQCLYLAGPGVCAAAMMTATFLFGYMKLVGYDWPFLLCLVSGSILCATDPVAVVGLLKELGASPTLTVQIQGESLLNDGTAIVLYTIAFNMLKGENYDLGDIIAFLVNMAIYAWGLGCVIGLVFFSWIKLANNKLNHSSGVIQVALTICTAYSSFVIAEGGFHISGVLSTVAAALVLAHKMWPEVVSRESMHTVWHMLEYLGNTVIFFLAGALSGKVMTKIDFVDYAHLLVIYIVIHLVRGSIFFGSRPLFKILHEEKKEVSVADATVMTWGGLRGAIGLALAIQVNQSRANEKISQADADRVLFYVSGIATLTLLINASSCPALVNYLGITQLPVTKKKMLSIVNRQLRHLIQQKTKPGRVREALFEILKEVEAGIQVPPSRVDILKENVKGARKSIAKTVRPEHKRPQMNLKHSAKVESVALDENDLFVMTPKLKKSQITASDDLIGGGQSSRLLDLVAGQQDPQEIQDSDNLVEEFYQAKNAYAMLPAERLSAMLMKSEDVPDVPLQDQENTMVELVTTGRVNPKTQRAINEAFLALVRAGYWKQIEHADFCGSEAEKVLTSVTAALSTRTLNLKDFAYIEPFIQASYEESGGTMSVSLENLHKSKQPKVRKEDQTPLHRFIEGVVFQMFIAVVIALNSVCTSVEQEVRGENDKNVFWLVSEIFFTVVFTVECILKLADLKCKYFMSSWNIFDFILVILGIFGCAFSIMVQTFEEDSNGGSAVPASESRMIRAAQVFRMMRIVRLFRLYRLYIKFRARVSEDEFNMDIAEHMQKAAILINFLKAHLFSQEKLLEFFGNKGKADTCEIARCILQSQVSCYKAFTHLEMETRKLSREILEDISISEENRRVAEQCERFIHDANKHGVLTGHEAESLLHPIHDHIRNCLAQLQESHAGHLRKSRRMSKPVDAAAEDAGQDLVLSKDVCACGSVFAADAAFCRLCGSKRPEVADPDPSAETIGKRSPPLRLSEPAQEPPTAPERDLTPVEEEATPVGWGRKAKEKNLDDKWKASATSPDDEKPDVAKKGFGAKKKERFQKTKTDQEEETKQLLTVAPSPSTNNSPRGDRPRFKKVAQAEDEASGRPTMTPKKSTTSNAERSGMGPTKSMVSSKSKAKGKSRPRWKKDKTEEDGMPV